MELSSVSTAAFQEEGHSPCGCCGRPMHTGAGDVQLHGHPIADYWYRWTDGHEGHFHLAVCPRGRDGEPVEGAGVVVVSAHQDSGNIIYSVVEPADSPWSDFGAYGAVLSRAQALGSKWDPELFELVDAVAAKEPRLAKRILNPSEGLN